MSQITTSPAEFATSTSSWDSLFVTSDAQTCQSSASALALWIDAREAAARPRRPGAVSAANILSAREKANPEYASRLSAARKRLANEFYGTPTSLSQMRLSKGLSQVALAEKLGTSQPHIAKIEAGKVKYSSPPPCSWPTRWASHWMSFGL
ncbi:ribosome-binding protein aMBF1 (putative translation factor) [Paraburkholderia sp. GAS206C]|uniref:helix-turn-helix domain-containing protein n=1 Tax=unclassified Paraburkholderia TaxID=2615204 RepID=UPI003D224EE7